MPQKSYYHFWYESYSEKQGTLTFWEFIELVKERNIPTLSFDLYRAYAQYFSDNPTEKERRLTTETKAFLEAIQLDDFRIPYFDRSNATQRLKDSLWKMLQPEISQSQLEKYWLHATQNDWVLHLPEDDYLDTRNLLGTVHKICCDFHFWNSQDKRPIWDRP